MGYCAGLDMSLGETALCIVDDTGRIVRARRAASESEALIVFFVGGGAQPVMAEEGRAVPNKAIAASADLLVTVGPHAGLRLSVKRP